MALTRKFLTALGIEADKVDEIINAHTETVDALKEERDKYKVNAEALPAVQQELAELKEATEKAGASGNAYQVKYEAIKEEYEQYKADVEAKATRASKESAYRALLKEAGISEKRMDAVLKVSGDEIDKLDLDADGKAKNAKDLVKSIAEEWSDFVVKESTQGANTSTPPGSSGGATMTKDDILKIKDTSERQKAMAENHELFGF